MFAYNYMFLKSYLRPQKSVVGTFMRTNKICSKRIIYDDVKIARCNYVLSTAINISYFDTNITSEDYINKGFAFLSAESETFGLGALFGSLSVERETFGLSALFGYLSFERETFGLCALLCFSSAKQLDKDKKYATHDNVNHL